jgi:competence protein ComEC
VLLALAAWSGWQVEQGLDQRLGQSYPATPVTGKVVSLPSHRDGLVSFRFRAERGPWGEAPRRLEVRWFDAGVIPRVGERWQLPLRLAPPRGRLNFEGGDRERYWFAQGVHALGTVKGDGAERLAPARGAILQRWREQIRTRLEFRLGGLDGNGLVRALALGDRGGLGDDLRKAMRISGTGHLLAISGLHVGLVALFAATLARGVLLLAGWRSLRWPARRLAPLVGLAVATGYAGLAGFTTSPRRAVVMLAVFVVLLSLRRRPGPWRAWSVALAIVLLADPMAPLQAGFWLSFGAVAVLIGLFTGRRPRPRGSAAFLRAQGGLMLALFPAGLTWFQSFGLGALPANALAIPGTGFVTLPLVLVSLLLAPFDGALPETATGMAERSAALLEAGLVWSAPALDAAVVTTGSPNRLSLALAFIGAVLCLLPRPLGTWRVGWLLVLPLLLPMAPLMPGAVQIDVLDVGQGQATLVNTATHRLLVDTGPGMPGTWSRVDEVIRPAFAGAQRVGPHLVLVSHADLDHAGGLWALRRSWPLVPVIGNRRSSATGMPPCHDGRAWTWDGVTFRVLHPSPFLPYRGNDSSCVLEISAAGGAVLMPGDAGHRVERRLPTNGAGRYRLLLAPHHGSRSSSSEAFLAWAQPDIAVFSIGHDNRFGFPHPEVTDRYRRRAIATGDTAGCGGMRFVLHADGRLEVRSARRERGAFWRFPAAVNCPPRAPGQR